MKLLTASVTLLMAVFVRHASDQATGSIEGTVIGERGNTVAGAWVSASGTKPLGGRIPGARTDDTGHFAIHSLDWDEYGLQACKEEDDVSCGPFFYRGETKHVRLTPKNPSATVEIRLGLKRSAIVSNFSRSTFPPDESETTLVAQFGRENVTDELIEGGGAEGDRNEGTVLFARSSDMRAEIFWKDKVAKQKPEWVRISGLQNRWRSPEGITLGTDLRAVEKLNRHPFRLAGLGFDGAGTVMSWQGGRLEVPSNSECMLRIPLRPSYNVEPSATEARLTNEVALGWGYSSGHPAMQELNPHVYLMMLVYRQEQPSALPADVVASPIRLTRLRRSK